MYEYIQGDIAELTPTYVVVEAGGVGYYLTISLQTYAELEPLDRAALRSILTEPKNAITRQYVKLFEMDGIKLTFDDAALDYIVDKAIEYRLGARGLRSICETIMMDSMYELPGQVDRKSLRITAAYVKSRLENENSKRLQAAG